MEYTVEFNKVLGRDIIGDEFNMSRLLSYEKYNYMPCMNNKIIAYTNDDDYPSIIYDYEYNVATSI